MLRVPENELAVVPQVPSVHTAIRVFVPTALVLTVNAANPIPSVGSVPIVIRVVAIKIGTTSPGLECKPTVRNCDSHGLATKVAC